MTNTATTITKAAEKIQALMQSNDIATPRIAITLGTGLADSLTSFTEVLKIEFSALDGFQQTTVAGHAGELIFGHLNNVPVILCMGRLHLYEGHSANDVVMPVYLLKQIGIEKLIITNAAGSLNPMYKPGEIMLIEDHINLTGQNPLIGQDETFGTIFTDMSQAYDKGLFTSAYKLAADAGVVHSGVYAGVLGPSLETNAERRHLRTIGADAVGMSTVMEVIAANHCGLKVLGVSAISNMALGDADQQADTIEDVLYYAGIAGTSIASLLERLLPKIETSS